MKKTEGHKEVQKFNVSVRFMCVFITYVNTKYGFVFI